MSAANHRNLVIILGDQLSDRLSAFEGFDRDKDAVWMAEVAGESTSTGSSKHRITIFLSAMRHFAEDLRGKGFALHYQKLDTDEAPQTLGESLSVFLGKADCEKVILALPGEHRVLEEIQTACANCEVGIEIREDNSFLSTPAQFAEHAEGRKQLRMEYFYREMRRRHGILMDGKQPEGGKWNYDASNRKSFGKSGPARLFPRANFPPDSITREVIQLVNTRFANHPGDLEAFAWPVNRIDAQVALSEFIQNELSGFGAYQDAMWTNEPFLSHSLLGSSINLKLLDPGEVVEAAEEAYRKGLAPIESVEGFIRQILGWREYVRGIYWLHMPEYLERNFLDAQEPLPEFYWSGDTDMHCLKSVISQTFRYGYAHHIQRLMVTGLYSLLLGVHPKKVHEWYLAVYVDAVEWVELPNTLGMSQYADGGVMGSKPYVATGKYIKRMSNYCGGCRFDPDKRIGADACPFTTLYWDFLDRNASKLRGNPRMTMQLKNLDNISPDEVEKIRVVAHVIKSANRDNSASASQ